MLYVHNSVINFVSLHYFLLKNMIITQMYTSHFTSDMLYLKCLPMFNIGPLTRFFKNTLN